MLWPVPQPVACDLGLNTVSADDDTRILIFWHESMI